MRHDKQSPDMLGFNHIVDIGVLINHFRHFRRLELVGTVRAIALTVNKGSGEIAEDEP